MKKYFLLTILLCQLTIVYGQKVLMEDDKVIQYDTDWGNWVSTPENSNISFCAKLNWYDKQTKLYNWSIRRKVTRTPIAYEWKITNQVFTGASDNPGNEGYYKSSAFDIRDNTNSMNGSGFSIYSSTKATLFYQVRNVCYVFDGRNPNCNSKTNNNTTNQTNNSSNNQNTKQTTTTSGSPVQTNKTLPNQTTQSQSNQVINTLPNNTNTEILNVLETTTNQVTNTLTNSIEKSKSVLINNELEIKNAREEFQDNNLSDKEIDSLLASPDPNNYATINIYEEIKCCHWYIFINGKNLPIMDKKNKKIEYRIYNSNKLLIQYYAAAGFGTTPMKTIKTRIRKGKTYHFKIKRLSMTDAAMEQIDEEPLDKKGNKVYENTNQKIKSDIE
jgi:hypothetical protein